MIPHVTEEIHYALLLKAKNVQVCKFQRGQKSKHGLIRLRKSKVMLLSR